MDIKNNIHHTSPILSKFMPWSILSLSLIITMVGYYFSDNSIKEKRSERFSSRSVEIKKAILDRMSSYEQALLGGVGLFHSAGTPLVSQDVFATYVETLNINKSWPGIQGIGFSVPVSIQEKLRHEADLVKKGFVDFKIRPPGVRESYSSIIYLEPFDWRNKRAHGYDMWSNQMRRNAMTRARDEGLPTTSGIITLVQETSLNVQKGFLTYLPVYKTRNTPKTIQKRQDNFVGWVYAPFRAGDLMKGIIGSKDNSIDFQVFDGEKMDNSSLLYSTLEDGLEVIEEENIIISEIISQGRKWQIKFSIPKNAYSNNMQNLPQIIAIFGVLVDFLLFFVIFALQGIAKNRSDKYLIENARLKENISFLEKNNQAS